ncbi:hypothetical protein PybrP1_002457 [[Pythium] brassicae (nom. inval.)]|nr:hypothetical protein PybrP1_002457 [[Pythium] brassicae (nom. inval.)]
MSASSLSFSLSLSLSLSQPPSHAPDIVREAQVAPDDVLEQARRRRLDEHADHLAEHGADCVEALGRVANVREPHLVQQDLLHNERRHLWRSAHERISAYVSVWRDERRKEQQQQRPAAAQCSRRTVLESSLPASMMRRQSGMISVCSKKLITSESSICGGGITSRACVSPTTQSPTRVLSVSCLHPTTPLAHLDERADDAEAREAQVLERPVLAHSVEERVQVQRNVRCRENERERGG